MTAKDVAEGPPEATSRRPLPQRCLQQQVAGPARPGAAPKLRNLCLPGAVAAWRSISGLDCRWVGAETPMTAHLHEPRGA
jgi:hypothetical protein